MAWYYYLNGGNQGPVELAELQRLHERNVVSLDTPVWTDGMADWAPFQSTAAAPVLAGPTQTCAECGKLFPEAEMLKYENSWVCATCKPVFFQRIKEGVGLKGNLAYATIGKRFVAVFVDGIILLICLSIPISLIGGTGALLGLHKNLPLPATIVLLLIQYVTPALYEILFIGKYGATPGKMLMKIKVVSPEGEPISYGRSTGRYFAKILSGLILYIGYLMAFWDPEKRALHDRICQTRVVDA
jgi:uncharacterized RDD family membrane protein YckC